MKRLAVALAVITLTAACGGSEETPTAAAGEQECGDLQGETLRVALASETDFSKIHVVKAIEDLEEQGVEVTVANFEGGSDDAFRALIAGEADVFDGSSLGSLLQFTQQVGPEVKYLVGAQTNTDYILVGSPDVETLDDLVGKTIGISSPGDISDTLTRYVLEDAGYNPDEFDFLQIGGTGARMAGLAAGQIQAGAAHAADGINAIEQNGLTLVYNYGDSIENYIGLGGGAATEWIADNQCLAQAYVDARVEANRWAAENKDEYIELSKEYVPEDALSDSARDQAYDIYADIDMFPVDGGMSSELLDGTVEVEQAVGQLTEDAPDPSDWADTSFVEDFLSRN